MARAGAAWAGALVHVALACPEPGDAAAAVRGPVEVAWTVVDASGKPSLAANGIAPGAPAVPVGRPFGLVVQACPADVALVEVDADMPAHRHGMNYRPRVHALAAGGWRVEGMLLHMPGDWRLRFHWRRADDRRVTTEQAVRAEWTDQGRP